MSSLLNRPDSPSPPSSSQAPTVSENSAQVRFYGCYLLVSRSKDLYSAGRTYVGFTVNPPRRLKQHNGLLKYGGAKRTSKHRPWQIVAVIHGFSSKTQGLQFEWAWQNPTKSAALRVQSGRKDAISLPSQKKNSVSGRLQTLAALVSIPPWALCPLTVSLCAEKADWPALGIQDIKFPKEAKVEFEPAGALQKWVRRYEYRQGMKTIVPCRFGEAGTRCVKCKESVSLSARSPGENNRRLTYCASCGALWHLSCLAKSGAKDDNASEKSLLPNYVHCDSCQTDMHWSLAVRLGRALESDD